LKGIIP